MAEWKPISEALTDVRVTGQQQTIFVMRYSKNGFPSYNAVYYDWFLAEVSGDIVYRWVFANGNGSYQPEWPTHWMLADEAATLPSLSPPQGQE